MHRLGLQCALLRVHLRVEDESCKVLVGLREFECLRLAHVVATAATTLQKILFGLEEVVWVLRGRSDVASLARLSNGLLHVTSDGISGRFCVEICGRTQRIRYTRGLLGLLWDACLSLGTPLRIAHGWPWLRNRLLGNLRQVPNHFHEVTARQIFTNARMLQRNVVFIG